VPRMPANKRRSRDDVDTSEGKFGSIAVHTQN
jgi:hypothetical protein